MLISIKDAKCDNCGKVQPIEFEQGKDGAVTVGPWSCACGNDSFTFKVSAGPCRWFGTWGNNGN